MSTPIDDDVDDAGQFSIKENIECDVNELKHEVTLEDLERGFPDLANVEILEK